MLNQKIIDDLKVFTKKIMDDEDISEYELKIEGQTEVGVNYGSEIVFFNVTSQTSGKKYNFVMKTTRRSEKLRKLSQDAAPDKREMHMYSKVFPALRKMLADCKTEYHLENIPKTYFVCTDEEHETAIMDDLRAIGYRLWDKQKGMNLEHINLVLRNYAMFHASSMALRLKNPQLFEDLTSSMDNVFREFGQNKSMSKMFKDYFEEALNVLREAGRVDIVEKLEHVPGDIMGIVGGGFEEEDKVIITHGDCWINNMMFRYESRESIEPTGFCLLDFQISSLGSPAIDLAYFIYASVDEVILKDNFYQFLRYYYDCFSSTLRDLGFVAEEVFAFQKLMEHWRKYAIRGLILGSILIKIQQVKKGDAPALVDDKGKEFDWSILKVDEIEDYGAYQRRAIAIYENYAETCLN